MKKLLVACVVAVLVMGLFTGVSDAKSNHEKGGLPAFIIGCCWGLREGTEWNEGADMHWREWCRIVPLVNLVISIWDGVECYQGITAHDWAQKNGANWY
jgi:hypothetical protein